MEKRVYGLIASPSGIEAENITPPPYLPESMKLQDTGGVWDQGNEPSCLAYSIASLLYWRRFISGVENSFSSLKNEVWKMRDPALAGMIPYDTFNLMVKSNSDSLKIDRFAKLDNVKSVKTSIFLSGPVIIGITVRNASSDKPWEGSENYGGHAMAITGYDNRGFEIKNSWGKDFGASGYTTMSYSDFEKYVTEAWTVLAV